MVAISCLEEALGGCEMTRKRGWRKRREREKEEREGEHRWQRRTAIDFRGTLPLLLPPQLLLRCPESTHRHAEQVEHAFPRPVERGAKLGHVAAEARQSCVDGLGELPRGFHHQKCLSCFSRRKERELLW